MATLQIRKLSEKVWKHIPSDANNFILSKLYAKTDGNTFKIIEDSGSNRKEYTYSDITVYDDSIGVGSPETFLSSQALMLRLEALKYVGFNRDGDVPTSIDEAPINGLIYGRKNAGWIEVTGGTTFDPATHDLTEFLNEDADPYVRVSGLSGSTPLATTSLSGTVKTDVNEADPIVYTKASVDALLINTATVTTAVSITNATLTDAGQTQDGKVNLIANGVNAINYTVNGAITASFIKGGTGAITFVQGAGRTLTGMNGTLILNGIVGSTASVVSYGTVDYLYINNL